MMYTSLKNLRILALSLLALLSLHAAAGAQCVKPPVPTTGFPLTGLTNVPVTYDDGYETRGELLYPLAPTPSCGWPLVIHVHGLGGQRTVNPGIAERGYAVWSYDVRGQGDAKLLNPLTEGLTFYGAVEKYDLAEQIAFVRQQYPNIVHATKVAITGVSQGGIEAWFAAAYSEKTVTIPGRGATGSIAFPKISCVAPWEYVAEFQDSVLRHGNMFSIDLLNWNYGSPHFVRDEDVEDQIDLFWQSQDPVGLRNTWESELDRPYLSKLATTDVPIFYAHAFWDGIGSPQDSMQAIASLPILTPARAHLSTNGHWSPWNTYESLLREELRIRWFDRFMWDIQNGVDDESAFVLGVMPLEDSKITNSTYPWGQRFLDSVPTATDRFFLNDQGLLSDTEPTVAGVPTVISHQVEAGYDSAFVVSAVSNWSLTTILQKIPLSQRVFSLPALQAETEMVGNPRVSLMVNSDAQRFTVAAALMARLPGATSDVMLCGEARGFTGAIAGVAQRVDITMPLVSTVLPAGTVLKLYVRNHWMRSSPMLPSFVTFPYLESSTTQVLTDNGVNASWLDLPFSPEVDISLTCPTNFTEANNAQPWDMEIRGGEARAGKPYFMVLGFNGQAPGFMLPGDTLPIKHSAATDLVWSLTLGGDPGLINFMGTLDANGKAGVRLDLPYYGAPVGNFVNRTITAAAWVYTSPINLIGRSSSPLDLLLR